MYKLPPQCSKCWTICSATVSVLYKFCLHYNRRQPIKAFYLLCFGQPIEAPGKRRICSTISQNNKGFVGCINQFAKDCYRKIVIIEALLGCDRNIVYPPNFNYNWASYTIVGGWIYSTLLQGDPKKIIRK